MDEDDEVKPLVSVVIPTKNSEQYLDKCLSSVKKQSYSPIEIIVVDNNSTDNTKKIAKKFTKKVYNKGPERCAQRNYGVKMSSSKSEFVYFVDSDFVLHPKIISEAVDACQKKGVSLVAVHNTSDPTISFWSKVRKFERDMYKGDPNNVGVRFMRKKEFLRVKGYDEEMIASEDYDLHNRLIKGGRKFVFIEHDEMHLGEPKSLWEIITKHYFYGKTIAVFVKKNKKDSKKQLKFIRSGYITHWKEFFKHPILAIGLFIYQFAKYGAAGCGYIVGGK